jgi:hypothetical protein
MKKKTPIRDFIAKVQTGLLLKIVIGVLYALLIWGVKYLDMNSDLMKMVILITGFTAAVAAWASLSFRVHVWESRNARKAALLNPRKIAAILSEDQRTELFEVLAETQSPQIREFREIEAALTEHGLDMLPKAQWRADGVVADDLFPIWQTKTYELKTQLDRDIAVIIKHGLMTEKQERLYLTEKGHALLSWHREKEALKKRLQDRQFPKPDPSSQPPS